MSSSGKNEDALMLAHQIDELLDLLSVLKNKAFQLDTAKAQTKAALANLSHFQRAVRVSSNLIVLAALVVTAPTIDSQVDAAKKMEESYLFQFQSVRDQVKSKFCNFQSMYKTFTSTPTSSTSKEMNDLSYIHLFSDVGFGTNVAIPVLQRVKSDLTQIAKSQ